MKNRILLLAPALLIMACDPDQPEHHFDAGLLVLNEGAFMGGTATLTHWSDTDSVTTDAFVRSNGRSLGNLGTGLAVDAHHAYVVLNGAASLEVLDLPSLHSVARITGFAAPRQVVVLPGGDLAVSDWGRNRVYRLSGSTWAMTDSVDLPEGPEAMMVHLGELWVTHSGGLGMDSAVSVLDPATLDVVATMEVGVNPSSIAVLGGSIYVLCSGYTDWSGGGADRSASLVKIDPATRSVTATYDAVFPADRPTKLATDGEVLYWIKDGYTGDVLRMDPTALDYPAYAWISGTAYGLFADGASNALYVLDAKDFQQNGEVRRYSPGGQLQATVPAGLIPTAAVRIP